MNHRENPSINIYNSDCLEAMKRMEDNQFDLAIVDPPYGIGFSNKIRDKKIKNWDTNIPNDNYFTLLSRVSKEQIVLGANYFPVLWKKGCRGFVFWHKDPNVDSFSDGELAFTSFIRPARYFYYAWNGLADGIKGRNKKEKTIHPAQKPVALYKWLLTNYAKEGDKILDTHLGSGSIAIACHDLGFNLEGFELDRDYYKSAKHRIAEHQKQLILDI